jgi:hypothetical protein
MLVNNQFNSSLNSTHRRTQIIIAAETRHTGDKLNGGILSVGAKFSLQLLFHTN